MSVPERKVIIPEVIEPDEKLPRDLVALRKFAYLMDEAVPVPGTRRRVGLDPGRRRGHRRVPLGLDHLRRAAASRSGVPHCAHGVLRPD